MGSMSHPGIEEIDYSGESRRANTPARLHRPYSACNYARSVRIPLPMIPGILATVQIGCLMDFLLYVRVCACIWSMRYGVSLRAGLTK